LLYKREGERGREGERKGNEWGEWEESRGETFTGGKLLPNAHPLLSGKLLLVKTKFPIVLMIDCESIVVVLLWEAFYIAFEKNTMKIQCVSESKREKGRENE
jgi:hypothetical protein